jgi:hypothetical protein
VHLIDQHVQNANAMTAIEEGTHEVPANEAGTPSNQDRFTQFIAPATGSNSFNTRRIPVICLRDATPESTVDEGPSRAAGR